jgi:hypothetical protein
MAEFAAWSRGGDGRPVVVGYPACYDWMFLYWYLIRFTGQPVRPSGCLDLRPVRDEGRRADGRRGEGPDAPAPAASPHTHHALDDALGRPTCAPTSCSGRRGSTSLRDHEGLSS